MSANHQRVYEPWQEGIDDEIAFLLRADIREKLHIRANFKTI
jgi:hypothetical protein